MPVIQNSELFSDPQLQHHTLYLVFKSGLNAPNFGTAPEVLKKSRGTDTSSLAGTVRAAEVIAWTSCSDLALRLFASARSSVRGWGSGHRLWRKDKPWAGLEAVWLGPILSV